MKSANVHVTELLGQSNIYPIKSKTVSISKQKSIFQKNNYFKCSKKTGRASVFDQCELLISFALPFQRPLNVENLNFIHSGVGMGRDLMFFLQLFFLSFFLSRFLSFCPSVDCLSSFFSCFVLFLCIYYVSLYLTSKV